MCPVMSCLVPVPVHVCLCLPDEKERARRRVAVIVRDAAMRICLRRLVAMDDDAGQALRANQTPGTA